MHTLLTYAAFSLLAGASIFFLIKNRTQYILYSVVILLILMQVIGAFLRILHLPGAEQLLLLGVGGTLLGGVLLIWRAFSNRQGQTILNKLLVGVLLIVQIALPLLDIGSSRNFAGLLNYPVTALLATVLINRQTEHEGEKNMMILFLVQGIFYILMNLLN